MAQKHALHLDPKVRQEARSRLLSAKGHLEGILKMLEGEPYCVDVLKQLKAVQGALDKVGEMILRSHLEHHVASAALRGDTQRMVEELMEVLKYR
ncbi:MAG: metal-sensitive transcriptional regulator [Meiothermus sp.]|uniref:metal-sensitive transcriptional regulator n=1 Tax=Meiothermus sp. TaxID=1955249 RepID=UPI00298F0425|nr:metal-sensitive transcriptional regulator [Meiothermus sp.]MCX7741111.1 metal-sensitive transcriptional regulator [Meiothermus sp.]MDW8481812.1 metal-sensitive transcriptional regulator [Meiothermus sp.]